jgi:hypothetical protein
MSSPAFSITVASRFDTAAGPVSTQADTISAVGLGLFRRMSTSGPAGLMSFWVRFEIDANGDSVRSWRFTAQNETAHPVEIDIDLALASSLDWHRGPVRVVQPVDESAIVLARKTYRVGAERLGNAIQAGAGAMRDIVRIALPGFASGQAVCRTEPRLPADLDADGRVDAVDHAILLGAWSQHPHIADINLDGLVDASDIAILLSQWSTQ